MQQFAIGNYTINDRRAVTQVTVSKLVDTYDHYVRSSVKQKLAGWLAELTGMQATDFFDPITHKGFLKKNNSKIIVTNYLQERNVGIGQKNPSQNLVKLLVRQYLCSKLLTNMPPIWMVVLGMCLTVFTVKVTAMLLVFALF